MDEMKAKGAPQGKRCVVLDKKIRNDDQQEFDDRRNFNIQAGGFNVKLASRRVTARVYLSGL